jgi:hypothetical protein
VTKAGAERFDRVPSGFNHRDVTPGVWYYYRVVAVNEGIESELSPEARAMVSSSINVSVVRPEGGTAGGSFNVLATVDPPFEVATVTASVPGAAGELTFLQGEDDCGRFRFACWTGTVSLDDVAYRNIVLLTVTAADVQGDSSAASVTIVKDEPPVVTVLAPLPYSVARPEIRVAASCSDDGPSGCTIRVFDGGVEIASADNNLDATVSVSSPKGVKISLTFRATDPANGPGGGRTVGPVFVENSPLLVELDSAPGRILDIDDTRILYLELKEGSPEAVIVRDRATGVNQVIFEAGPAALGTGRLTPWGVVFPVWESQLYVWRGGTVGQLTAEFYQFAQFEAAGDFVAWIEGADGAGELKRRNIVTGETIVVTSGILGFDLAGNGDVVYHTVERDGPPGYNIFRFNDLGTEQLTFDSPDGLRNVNPTTDGANVVFKRFDSPRSQVVAITPAGEIALAPLEPVGSYQHQYAAANGWIVYTTLGGGQRHVWRRSPAGVSEQLTFFSRNSFFEALGPDGGVFFFWEDLPYARRYFVPPGEGGREIGTTFGTPGWVGSRPVVVIGRMVFEVH